MDNCEEKWWSELWLLAYWWQALILILLYSFLFLIYKEMAKHSPPEVAAIFMINRRPTVLEEDIWQEGQLILLYSDELLELSGEKLYVRDSNIFLEKEKETIQLKPGENFDFAKGSLKLVRWNNACQFIDQYRAGTKSQ